MGKKKWWILFYTTAIVGVVCLAELGSRTAAVMAQSAPLPRRHRIVIDPGHGGEDGGATSCTGVLESSYNLSIALRLDDLFHLLGYDTVIVRRTDTSIYTSGETIAQKKISDLRERVRIVEETENALLLSIHQNHFPDSRYYGAQVFYADTPGSQQLAEALQTAFTTALDPGSRRKCKKSTGVYLMEHIHATGVLIECGFLSNPGEEAKLRDSGYQKKLCCAIASTVSSSLSERGTA